MTLGEGSTGEEDLDMNTRASAALARCLEALWEIPPYDTCLYYTLSYTVASLLIRLIAGQELSERDGDLVGKVRGH
jgi:hypothetical protein